MSVSRFTDLRVFTIWNALDWSLLLSLPDTLEELSCQLWNMGVPETTLPLSKLPPRLRVLSLDGPRLTLEFDTVAPLTLVHLELGLIAPLEPHELEKYFPAKNLRVVRGVLPLTPESLTKLPNVQEISVLNGILEQPSTLEILPRKLKRLILRNHQRLSPSLSFKHLPPALEDFSSPILCSQDVSDLPKSITHLRLERSPENASLTIPTAVWRQLPPLLKRLEVITSLFESEEFFQALPDGLEELILKGDTANEMIERVSFPKSLQASLKELSLSINSQDLPATGDSLFSKLGDFSRLESIVVFSPILIKSSTLSCLPKTLVKLDLKRVVFENFGLPFGKECDWKEGALSRLPEDLESLDLHYWRATPGSIDFKIFSYLPRRLVSLDIFSGRDVCKNPKSFIASLPRRLQCLSYSYDHTTGRGNPEFEESLTAIAIELKIAIKEYFSDPFWDGQRYDF